MLKVRVNKLITEGGDGKNACVWNKHGLKTYYFKFVRLRSSVKAGVCGVIYLQLFTTEKLKHYFDDCRCLIHGDDLSYSCGFIGFSRTFYFLKFLVEHSNIVVKSAQPEKELIYSFQIYYCRNIYRFIVVFCKKSSLSRRTRNLKKQINSVKLLLLSNN